MSIVIATQKTEQKNGILFPKSSPNFEKKTFFDGGKLLKVKAEDRVFAKILRSLEQFINSGRSEIFWKQNDF